jgi:hypothetical protein
VLDDLRNSASLRRGDGNAKRQRVEQDRAHSFFARAQCRNGCRREQPIGVGSVPGHVHDVLKAEVLHFALDVGSQRTVANEKRVGIRDALMNTTDRPNEVDRIFVPDQLRDLHHERSIDGNSEGRELISIGRGHRTMHVDAIGNDVDSASFYAAPLEDIRDRLRDRDDGSCTSVLPAGAKIGPERKVHTSRDDEPRRRSDGGESANGYGMRCVSVYDVDLALFDLAPQTHYRHRIELESRIALDDLQTLLESPLRKRLSGAGCENGNMTLARELAREPEGLSLTASPSAFGIDMQHAIGHGAQLPRTEGRPQGSMRAAAENIAR